MNKVILKPKDVSYYMTEGVKTMRTNILFSRDDRKVILVTSSIAGEGKSTVSRELAQSLAELDKKVLLIDADMRKSVMVNQIITRNELKGLSHFLSGQQKISEVITSTNVRNLHLIVSGPMVSNSAELLSGPLFVKMMETLREHYDYIIVDGAPVGLVVDSSIIGEHVDAAVFVVESGKVKYKFAQKAIANLEASGCIVLGVILNKFDMKKTGSYYSAYQKQYKAD